MPKTAIEPIGDPLKDRLLTPQNCAVVLIDYQPEQVATVQSSPIEEVMLNVQAVCKLARAYDVPVILSTVGVDMGVNMGTIDELRKELPNVPAIDRTGVNSWEDADFRAAVEATGRKKIVICGLWPEVCLAFPTLAMLAEGYEGSPFNMLIFGLEAWQLRHAGHFDMRSVLEAPSWDREDVSDILTTGPTRQARVTRWQTPR